MRLIRPLAMTNANIPRKKKTIHKTEKLKRSLFCPSNSDQNNGQSLNTTWT